MKYKLSDYAKLQKVTYRTAWQWIKDNKIVYEITKTGRILVVIPEPDREKRLAIYCRVSSSENKSNLDRQAERLISFANAKGYKVDQVVKEVGSGLNDQRKKLQSLLQNPTIDIILVEHKDRLTRFGFHYIQNLLALQGRKIEVVNTVEDEKADLIADFTSIITSFCARIYGQRRTKRQTERLIASLKDEKCI